MTAPQDAPAGPVLGEAQLQEIERNVERHASVFPHGGSCWIDRDVPLLIAAVRSLSSAREEGRAMAVGALLACPEPPVGSIVEDGDGDIWTRDERGWWCSLWEDGADDPARSPWSEEQDGDSYSGEPVTHSAPVHLARWGTS